MSDLLNSASLVMIPSGYKEDTVFSAIPTDGSGDLSFTRASNGTRVNSAGLVEVCPWNLLSNSEEFTSANGWFANTAGGSTATQTSDYGVAPNGTTTADRIQLALNGGGYADWVLVPTTGIIVGQVYTYSIYMKSLSGTKTIKFFNDAAINVVKTITTEWVRYDYTWTVSNATIYPRFLIDNSGETSTSADILAWGYQINIGSTAKPYFPTTDRLNVPRLTYQNGGGGCPSLLLEKQSTNYLNYSNDFTQAAWSASGSITRTANYAVSPDGTQTATRIQWNGTDGELYQYLGQASPTRSSVYVKGTAGQVINFCLNLITLTGEWQRIEAASLIDGSNTWFGIITKSSVGHTATDFLLWGGQGENGTYATSLIYTTSASATRVQDACSKTGISSLIGQSEGVVFADFIWEGSTTGGADYPISIYGSSYSDFVGLNTYENTNSMYVYVGGSNVVAISGTTFVNGQRYKIAMAYKLNDFVYYLNGTQMGTDTSGGVPSSMANFQTVTPFAGKSTSQKFNEIILFKTRLTNAELASLTTI